MTFFPINVSQGLVFDIFDNRSSSPSPSQRIGKKPSQRTASRSASSIYHVNVALPDTSLLQRDDVGKENRHDRVHAPSAHASHCPRDAKLRHALGQAAAQAADAKDGICKQETCLSAEYVAELAVERLEACESEKVSLTCGQLCWMVELWGVVLTPWQSSWCCSMHSAHCQFWHKLRLQVAGQRLRDRPRA